jgi:formylglycine-generating enzyme required for sulfatase activity
MKLRLIPPGEFLMGSSAEEIKRIYAEDPEYAKVAAQSETPTRRVRIEQPCYLGIHEVTVEQFRRFVKDTGHKTGPETNGVGSWGWKGDKVEQSKEFTWQNPQFSVSENLPVVCIDYEDAQAFCAWLSRVDKRQYEIPHESVWEFACRAGTTGLWYWGNQADDAAKFAHPVPSGSHPVAEKPANAFGLFDMLGNVHEFARADQQSFVWRGGASGDVNVWRSRSALRATNADLYKSGFHVGFRVALVGDLKAKAVAAVQPFVVLDAKNKKEHTFPNLAEAVAAAVKGDTIEIRDDGPFVMPPLNINGKALIIRAGFAVGPGRCERQQEFADDGCPART